MLRSGTDTDHAVYFSRNAYVLDTALNFGMNYAPKSGSATRLALTTLLRRKGRMLDAAAAALATIRSKLSPDDKKLLDELDERARAAREARQSPGRRRRAASDYAKEVAALEDKIAEARAAGRQEERRVSHGDAADRARRDPEADSRATRGSSRS